MGASLSIWILSRGSGRRTMLLGRGLIRRRSFWGRRVSLPYRGSLCAPSQRLQVFKCHQMPGSFQNKQTKWMDRHKLSSPKRNPKSGPQSAKWTWTYWRISRITLTCSPRFRRSRCTRWGRPRRTGCRGWAGCMCARRWEWLEREDGAKRWVVRRRGGWVDRSRSAF